VAVTAIVRPYHTEHQEPELGGGTGGLGETSRKSAGHKQQRLGSLTWVPAVHATGKKHGPRKLPSGEAALVLIGDVQDLCPQGKQLHGTSPWGHGSNKTETA
jgi:hypothetical protein